MSVSINHCPIWGFKADESYTSFLELRCSYDICDCCGCEYGHDDDLNFYADWVKDGCVWFEAKAKPQGWTLDDQVRNQIRPWPPK